MLVGAQDIQVGEEHVSGVALALQTGGEVTGSVAVDGPAPARFKDLKVTLAVPPGAVNLSAPSSQVGDNGKFTLKNVTPARYQVQVTGGADSAYLKSVRLAEQEVPEDGFDFAGGTAGPLEVRLSLEGAQVTGVALDSEGKPRANATAVLMPDSKRATLYREARTDASGNFTFKGVTPGEYKVAAWDDIEIAAYKDAEYLKKVAGQMETVSVKESDSKSVTLKVIPNERR